MVNLIGLAIPGFFVAMGVELFVAHRRGLRVYRLADAISDLGCGIGQQLVSIAIAGLALGAYEWGFERRVVELPTWASWPAAVLGVEFAYYWWHRLSHSVNLLWAAHVVHHHSEDYNLAVALRQSVTTWATQLLFYWPLSLLGVPKLEFAVVLSLSTLYQFWIHTALINPLGALERWLNTPSLHRVHHAINARYLDKNHGATFSVFDRLFGTWQPETEPCVYGTTKPLRSFNPLWAQVEAYVELLRLAARAPTLLDVVKVFFASPAWRPEWMGSFTPRDPTSKYEVHASQRVKRYAVFNWLLVLVATFVVVMWQQALPKTVLLLSGALIVLGVVSVPALLEGKRWARPFEVARWVVTVPVVAWLVSTAT